MFARIFQIYLVLALIALALSSAAQGDAGTAKQPALAIPSALASQGDLRGTKALPLVVEPIQLARDPEEARTQAQYRDHDATTSRWMMWLTAGLLAIAAAQACLFFIQLRLMRRSMTVAEAAASAAENSVDVMRDTARRQLRAYLSIDRAWIEFPEPGVPSATVVIKNAGQTPAHNVRHWIHQWIGTYPLQDDLPVPPEGFIMSTDLLGSGATHSMHIRHPKPIIKSGFFDEIGSSAATVYVYGEVTYMDVFSSPQILKYRLMYGGRTTASGGTLKPCEEGNEAT